MGKIDEVDGCFAGFRGLRFLLFSTNQQYLILFNVFFFERELSTRVSSK